MATQVYHLQAKEISVEKDGHPHWKTVCGIRLDEKVVGITSNKADLTCPKCKGTK